MDMNSVIRGMTHSVSMPWAKGAEKTPATTMGQQMVQEDVADIRTKAETRLINQSTTDGMWTNDLDPSPSVVRRVKDTGQATNRVEVKTDQPEASPENQRPTSYEFNNNDFSTQEKVTWSKGNFVSLERTEMRDNRYGEETIYAVNDNGTLTVSITSLELPQ